MRAPVRRRGPARRRRRVGARAGRAARARNSLRGEYARRQARFLRSLAIGSGHPSERPGPRPVWPMSNSMSPRGRRPPRRPRRRRLLRAPRRLAGPVGVPTSSPATAHAAPRRASSTRPARPTSSSGSTRPAASSRPSSSPRTCRYFTLYGDGTVVFVQSNATAARSRRTAIGRGQPVRTGEADRGRRSRTLLEFALATAASGSPAPSTRTRSSPTRRPPCSRSTPTAPTKTVSRRGARDGRPAARAPTRRSRQALAKLGERLRDFDRGGTLSSAPYEPAAYRARADRRQRRRAAPRSAPGRGPSITLDDFTLPGRPERAPPGDARC